MMACFAVVGDPIAHSKSPRMHHAAYRALGLPHRYEAVRASAEELPAVVERLRAGEFQGLNVTVPHKARVLELVDHVDKTARAVGAANTLVRNASGVITAYNTDVPALAAELRELGAREGTALVLGAGGAGKAAAFALREYLQYPRVIVLARRGGDGPLAPDPAREEQVSVIVQATTCGMHGADPGQLVSEAIAWDALPDAAVALDVVYAPPETPFLAAAFRRGLSAANGEGMLVRQGALAFELWLGVRPPFEAMRAALRDVG
jgi:shikimate dehydrogenase